MAAKDEDELVKSKPRAKTTKRKSRSIDWYSEHDTNQGVFEYVRDGYNQIVGVRVDGGIYQ